ncbi:MAG TPA: NADH:ubiquinone reductase (Na(+)-transporting) subunit A, partial [Candidatus Bathyarchaeia archaeon]|nr:NADH:ubiquinone reductase (Na(+)-transporting) subunit A [Candidatus Bathyarchaeia archaeon]
MKTITIKKGKDIFLKGLPQARLEEAVFPERVAVKPTDFCGLKPRLLVKEGDVVKLGSPVIEDKIDSRIKIPSPVSGMVVAIRRGEKRILLEIVIQPDGRQDAQQHTRFSPSQLSGLFRQQIIDHLLDSGAWSFLRQRPFDHIADPSISPKAIFVKAIDTNPLSGNMDLMLEGKEEDIRAGLGILSKMTDGPVYLCVSPKTHLSVLQESSTAQVIAFAGPHPAGNVGTHIHYLSPLDKGERVWYL